MDNVQRFSKIAVILYFISMESFLLTSGACLNYGHACWGAHGKRSENRNTLLLKILHSMAQQRPVDSGNSVTFNPTSTKSFANQWVPNWVDIYRRKPKSYGESY